jgi:hypothetical protein
MGHLVFLALMGHELLSCQVGFSFIIKFSSQHISEFLVYSYQ